MAWRFGEALRAEIGETLESPGEVDAELAVPFFKNFTPNLGWVYIPVATFIIVGASNAVNLTDGLDGLAIGPVTIAAVTYMIFAYVAGHARIAEYLQQVKVPDPAGSGKLGDEAILWRSDTIAKEVTSDVPTPAFYDGDFFLLSDLRKRLGARG